MENQYYVVDKTLMIKEFLEWKSSVTLITRSRRFGKTLNMSMLANFFDITKDSKEIFKDTKIMKTNYADQINQYPTIFITFAGVKNSLQEIVNCIKLQIQNEYDRYEYVFTDMSKFKTINYEIISNREAGSGRCDIILKAKKALPSYVMEFKYRKDKKESEKATEGAVKQIIEKGYDKNQEK